jgi:hypothetical protein
MSKEEGRRKREEGRGKREEGRGKGEEALCSRLFSHWCFMSY